MAGTSKRLMNLTTSSIAEEVGKAEGFDSLPMNFLSAKQKKNRKFMAMLRDQTQTMLIGGDMDSLDESGRSRDPEQTGISMTLASLKIADDLLAIEEEKERALQLSRPNIFELAEKAKAKAQEEAKRKWPVIAPASFTLPASGDALPTALEVDASPFHEMMEQRMEAREALSLPSETERLRMDVEALAQANSELEERLQIAEARFKDCDAALREQKSMNEHLSEMLSEKNTASADELAVAAMMLAEPDRNISAVEALQTAEVLSAGRLVVLPTARKSATEVPRNFVAGGKLLQLLLRLSQLWLPKFLESGDVVARTVFSNSTYSARETNTLQGTKKLMQTRIFKYRGQDMPMLRHLCIGVKRYTSKTLRVYFEVDRKEGKVVVGWCGEHLPTTTART